MELSLLLLWLGCERAGEGQNGTACLRRALTGGVLRGRPGTGLTCAGQQQLSGGLPELQAPLLLWWLRGERQLCVELGLESCWQRGTEAWASSGPAGGPEDGALALALLNPLSPAQMFPSGLWL